MDLIVLIMVLLYFAILMGIGIYSSRMIKNTTDYLVAGRRLSAFVLAGTLAATVLDGGSTLGVVGNSFGKWGFGAIWYIIAMGIAFICMSFLAPLLRKTEAETVPEFFRMRYGNTAGLLHGILTIISMVGLVAAQLKASATVLEVMLGLDYNTSLLCVAMIITVYSVLGGFLGVALTDVIQLIVILVGMGTAVPWALRYAGGWRVIQMSLNEGSLSITGGIGGYTEILAYVVLFFCAFMVGEEVIPSYFAANDDASARRGSRIAGVVVIVFSIVPVILGLAIQSMYNNHLLNSGVVQALEQDAKYALPALAVKSMPSVIVGVLFAGIISATMSSADSSLLGAGSVYSNDIYHIFINPKASNEKIVAVARVTMIFVMTLSFFTAIYAGNILTILAFSFGIRAAGSFIPFIMGYIWDKGDAWTCNMSILIGTIVFLMANTLGKGSAHAWPIFPGLLASALTYMLFSILERTNTNKNKI